jgi:hypothetical protein
MEMAVSNNYIYNSAGVVLTIRRDVFSPKKSKS